MDSQEKALPSKEKLLSTAAELGGEDAVAEPIEAALEAGGEEHVLNIDPKELNKPAKVGFIEGILKHLRKNRGV